MDIIQLPLGYTNVDDESSDTLLQLSSNVNPVPIVEENNNLVQTAGYDSVPEHIPNESVIQTSGALELEPTNYIVQLPNGDVDPECVIEYPEQPYNYTFQFRRGPSSQWTTDNPVLAEGEPGFETDTGNVKIGNGVTPWSELKYIPTESTIVTMISTAIDNITVLSAASVQANLDAHIVSQTPHPVYDSAPSLFLLYQNAKV